MRHSPAHEIHDAALVRALIRENPWATIVSSGERELIASHCPVLLEEDSRELAVVTHVGRPDEELHRLGSGELLLIVAGPHGYISPSWYSEQAIPVPTWNFSVAHCYGVPEILDAEENLRALSRLVAHFERHVERPLALEQELGAHLAGGTLGIRLPIERFRCKLKMSQDKDPASRRQVLDQLRGDGRYANAALAEEMERALRNVP